MKIVKTCNRVPVVYKKIPLMPMKWRKAKRLAKANLAKFQYTKDGIIYLRLKFKPSGFDTQPIHLGIDPGSCFDGFSVVSKTSHHENIELIHNKKIKNRMSKRAMFRKIRRSRLWHRKIRFDNRISEKLVPTIRSMIDFRVFTIKEFLKLYPISKIIIEDIAYNHYQDKTGKGKGFSQVEIGKSALYEFVMNKLNVNLDVIRGYTTKRVRVQLFGTDRKSKNKAEKSFWAHCLDSFSIATIGLNFKGSINNSVRFLKKIWFNRRELFKIRALQKDKKHYFKYKKGGLKDYFVKLGKSNICRIKPEGVYSNHPKKWIYKDYGKKECIKHSQSVCYGGTIVQRQSRSSNPIGISKKAIYNERILGYQNRIYSVSYS